MSKNTELFKPKPPSAPRMGCWQVTIKRRRWFAPWYVLELNRTGGVTGYAIPPRRRAVTFGSAIAKAHAWISEKARKEERVGGAQ